MKNIRLHKIYGRSAKVLLSTLLTVMANFLCCTQMWAFNQSGVIYFDNSETKWDNVYYWIGKDNATSCYTMSLVSGTQYLYQGDMSWNTWNNGTWNSASMWFISKTNTAPKIGDNNNIYWKWAMIGVSNSDQTKASVTCDYASAYTNNYVYSTDGIMSKTQESYTFNAYKWKSVAYDTYEVSLNNDASKGAVTMTDYAGTQVTSGTNKPYLTVLNISITPSGGYTLASVIINGVDYAAEFSESAGTFTYSYTMKAAATIAVVYRHTPKVILAENAEVSDDEVTLSGYIAYKSCKVITEYGFVYSPSNSTPTTSDIKMVVGSADAAEKTHYTKTFNEDNGSFYYRAYIIAGGETYYSDVATFTVSGVACDATAGFLATINGATEASAAFKNGISETVTLSSSIHGTAYTWNCTSANSSNVRFENAGSYSPSTKRTVTAHVTAIGTYTFQLTATCSGSKTSNTVTLYVCAPANPQVLLLDNHTANIICNDGKDVATATCKNSQAEYFYTLYNGNKSYGRKSGGGILEWTGVDGEGTFIVTSSPSADSNCAVEVGRATQNYNTPKIDLLVSPSASVVAYSPVTITVSGTSTIDGSPKWEITQGESGYLLNAKTHLVYDGRARNSVIFKGGLDNSAATTYKVTATGTRTVEILDSSDKKTCESSATATISVSPVTNNCN